MLAVSTKDIDYGIKKVVTFALVNSSRTKEQKVESLDLLAAALGLDGVKFDHLIKLVQKYYEDEGYITVGILAGLAIAEAAHEKHLRNTNQYYKDK